MDAGWRMALLLADCTYLSLCCWSRGRFDTHVVRCDDREENRSDSFFNCPVLYVSTKLSLSDSVNHLATIQSLHDQVSNRRTISTH